MARLSPRTSLVQPGRVSECSESHVQKRLSTGDFTKKTCGRRFGGVFAMDELSRVEPKRGNAYVINTDDRDERGVHWVCCCFGDDVTVYMDSYGAPPAQRMADFMRRGDKPIIYSNVQIQSLESDVCGQHCIALIKALGATREILAPFNEYIYGFDLHDLEQNDARLRH